LQWLRRQELSKAAKAAVLRALGTVAERGAIRDTVRSRLIVEGHGDQVTRDTDGHWHAPINELVGVTLQSAELMAEDIQDTSALEIAARHFKKKEKLRGLEISLAPSNGGGNRILPCFQSAIAARQRFTFAITDSDKKHPNDTSGEVSRHCANSAKEAQWICKHVELPCHEIENLLPLNLIVDAINSSSENASLKVAIDRIVGMGEKRVEALRYTDLKNGIFGRVSTTSELNVDRRTFWKSVIRDCGYAKEICEGECDNTSCQCTIHPGLGTHVVQHFLDHCSHQSEQKQVERMNTSPHAADWLAVGKAVFDWGIADPVCRA
jgi:hypothetical protein